jgi:CrcB protein
MSRFLWVCLGGALGTGARYLLSIWALQALGPSFPFGTFLVNVIGSFLLGVIAGCGEAVTPAWRVTLSVGVMGGFTTYSSFNLETLRMLEERDWGLAALYMGATVIGCLLAGAFGLAVSRTAVGS